MKFNKEKFFEAIGQIAEQNLLTEEETKSIIKESVFRTFYSKFDPDADLEMTIDPDNQIFKLVNNTKMVVLDDDYTAEYRSIEIPMSEAIKIKPDVEEGGMISEEVDFAPFAKKIANQVRQLLIQNVREKKKEAVYAKHKSLKGEMITAKVTSSTASYVIFELEDGTTAFMPSKLRNLNIPLNIGEYVKVFVEDVLSESKDSQIVVSNGSPTMVRRILESEVPEISEGIIEIVGISRIAGQRSKVAVKSNNPQVDAVGAVIGASGSRINAIVKKLEGEKLDIINWSDDINSFVVAALAPAKVISIIDKKDDEGNIVDGHKVIITPNKHQTLAIGRQGVNARLVVELTKTRVDILSMDDAVAKNIEIEWNGNVTEDILEKIESGVRIERTNTRPSRPSFKSFDLEDDISSFAESIEIEDSIEPDVEEESLVLDDDMFSDDELKQMEANFGFDMELEELQTDEEYEKSINESFE